MANRQRGRYVQRRKAQAMLEYSLLMVVFALSTYWFFSWNRGLKKLNEIFYEKHFKKQVLPAISDQRVFLEWRMGGNRSMAAPLDREYYNAIPTTAPQDYKKSGIASPVVTPAVVMTYGAIASNKEAEYQAGLKEIYGRVQSGMISSNSVGVAVAALRGYYDCPPGNMVTYCGNYEDYDYDPALKDAESRWSLGF